jgi:hydrogenase-4 component B
MLLVFGISFILSGGLISLFVPEKIKSPVLSLFSGAGWLCLAVFSCIILITGGKFAYEIEMSYPVGAVNVAIDGLSAFFIILISTVCLAGTVYSGGYLKHCRGKNMSMGMHFFFIAVFNVSMILVVSVQNVVAFLIVWEVMTLSSVVLMMFENERKEVLDAGIKYIVSMHVGVVMLIIGFVLLSSRSGKLDFSSFNEVLSGDRILCYQVFLIFFAGFGMKAGFFPLHSWLPDAHPSAPSHISAVMSGIMIKLGIYGMLRVILMIGKPPAELSVFMIVISVITALYGIIFAVFQKDMKRVLAYSSMENIGIIGTGIGLGMLGLSLDNRLLVVLGFSGCFLHILNHSLFKSLLFFGAGSVYSATHTRNMEELGGLSKTMPVTSVLFLVGSVAICGLPPLNGFISEFIIYYGMLNAMTVRNIVIPIISILSVGALSFVGAMALVCFTRIFGIAFLGNPRGDAIPEKEAAISMLVPEIILASAVFFIGIFPGLVLNLLKPVTAVFLQGGIFDDIKYDGFVDTLNNISIISAVFIGLFIVIYVLRKLLLMKKVNSRYKTWDCGYQAGTGRIQYTGESFSEILGTLFRPFTNIRTVKRGPEGYFPAYADFKTKVFDTVDMYLINPLYGILKKLFNLFSWIQSGSTQQYILYGLIFLVFAILWVVGIQK